MDDTRDARWISLISITMKHAVLIPRIMSQQRGQGPEQMRYDNMWDACIDQRTDKKERNRACKLKARYREQQCLSQIPNQHCLSQKREHTVSRRDGASRRGGKENTGKQIFVPTSRDAFELIRICWTPKTKRRESGCFPIDSQLIGHFPTKGQALPRVTRLHSGSL